MGTLNKRALAAQQSAGQGAALQLAELLPTRLPVPTCPTLCFRGATVACLCTSCPGLSLTATTRHLFTTLPPPTVHEDLGCLGDDRGRNLFKVFRRPLLQGAARANGEASGHRRVRPHCACSRRASRTPTSRTPTPRSRGGVATLASPKTNLATAPAAPSPPSARPLPHVPLPLLRTPLPLPHVPLPLVRAPLPLLRAPLPPGSPAGSPAQGLRRSPRRCTS